MSVSGLPVSMSKQETVSQRLHYVLDLSLTEINGAFLCPRCGLRLSPDDETEDNYSIVETKVCNNNLEELTVECKQCRSEIQLVGFCNFDTEE
jgi:hypothetical protein